MAETIFTCRRCKANYEVGHIEQLVTECPVCGWVPGEEAERRRLAKVASELCHDYWSRIK